MPISYVDKSKTPTDDTCDAPSLSRIGLVQRQVAFFRGRF